MSEATRRSVARQARGRRLADHLPPALGGGEIVALFQPQVALADGAIVGAEALARWRPASGGDVGAERLLDAADRAHLTDAVADAIHAAALSDAAGWPAGLEHLRLSINLTAADVARPGFAAALLDRAAAAGFPSHRLTLEVTEHDLIADLDRAAGVLQTLRDAGCRVALDDFGTGYCGLAYLKTLPADVLKLDARLTHDIEGSPRGQTVLRGIIQIARALGMSVVVEGIETERQRDLLRDAGADVYQGFLCSGPITTADLVVLVGSADRHG